MSLQDWAHVAEITTSVAAISGLFFIWLQIRAASDVADSASAFESYRQFLSAALSHPQFISPENKLNVKDGTFDGKEVEFLRYEAFVDMMLSVFDEMLHSASSKEANKYMKGWLREHRGYLDSCYFKKNYKDELSPELLQLIYP